MSYSSQTHSVTHIAITAKNMVSYVPYFALLNFRILMGSIPVPDPLPLSCCRPRKKHGFLSSLTYQKQGNVFDPEIKLLVKRLKKLGEAMLLYSLRRVKSNG